MLPILRTAKGSETCAAWRCTLHAESGASAGRRGQEGKLACAKPTPADKAQVTCVAGKIVLRPAAQGHLTVFWERGTPRVPSLAWLDEHTTR